MENLFILITSFTPIPDSVSILKQYNNENSFCKRVLNKYFSISLLLFFDSGYFLTRLGKSIKGLEDFPWLERTLSIKGI